MVQGYSLTFLKMTYISNNLATLEDKTSSLRIKNNSQSFNTSLWYLILSRPIYTIRASHKYCTIYYRKPQRRKRVEEKWGGGICTLTWRYTTTWPEMVHRVKGGGRPSPPPLTPGWAEFSIVMECTLWKVAIASLFVLSRLCTKPTTGV